MCYRCDAPWLINCLECHLQGDGISPLVQTSVLGKGVKHRPPPIKMPSGSGSSSSGTPEKDKSQSCGVCKRNLKKKKSQTVLVCMVLSFRLTKQNSHPFSWGYLKGSVETVENHRCRKPQIKAVETGWWKNGATIS